MQDSPTKMLKDYEKASKAFRKEIRRDPEKAKAFLIRAGICVKSKKDPSGLELAPRYR